jgi:acyl carrier protein
LREVNTVTDDIQEFLFGWAIDWRPNLNRTDLKNGTRLVEDLGIDSLSVLELVTSIEDRFGIEVLDEEYQSRKSFGTLGAVAEVIAKGIRRASIRPT